VLANFQLNNIYLYLYQIMIFMSRENVKINFYYIILYNYLIDYFKIALFIKVS